MATIAKLAKAKARRKDYEKKRNIRNRNAPIPRINQTEDIMRASLNKGKMTYIKVGTRTVKIKLRRVALEQGDGVLPPSRKHTPPKDPIERFNLLMQRKSLKYPDMKPAELKAAVYADNPKLAKTLSKLTVKK